MDADLQYTWRAQRRGFFREALKGGECDLVLGVPAGFERALTTRPYYRSTYVFVSRKDRGLTVRSFDDPALRTLKIGVQLIGDDGVNTPPAHALAARGIVDNVVGLHGLRRLRRGEPAGPDRRGRGQGGRRRRGRLGAAGGLLRPRASRAGDRPGRAGGRTRRACRWPSTSRWACARGTRR